MCRERVNRPKTKSAEQALTSLMRQCARAEKSSGDAMRLMARWGVEQQMRAGVLERLIAEKFIDDRRYAQAYIREKINLSGWGERKIAASLRVKGVASAIISELLSELDGVDMQARLLSKLERRAKSVKYKDIYDLKGKLVRYGVGLGYGYDVVINMVSKLVKHDD